jgi:hypothetical protein
MVATLSVYIKPTSSYFYIVLYNMTLNIYNSQMQGIQGILRLTVWGRQLLKYWIILFIGFSEVNLEMVYVYSDHASSRA